MEYIFKTIRKSYLSTALTASLLSNIMIFAQPTEQMMAISLNNKMYIITDKFESYSNRINTFPIKENYNEDLFAKFNSKSTDDEGSANKATIKKHNTVNLNSTNIDKSSTENVLSFFAIETSGTIGKAYAFDAETPEDNFFTVYIPDKFNFKNYDAVLVYDLYGLESATQTTKIINNTASFGGQLAVLDESWKTVKEYISADNLFEGLNEIFFTLRADEIYQYQIKNLRIDFVEKNDKAIQLSESVVTNFGGNIYFSGFVREDVVEIEVFGKTIPVHNGVFECYIEDIPEYTEQIQISYKISEGQVEKIDFPIQYMENRNHLQFPDGENHINFKNITPDELKDGRYQYYALRIETDADITGNSRGFFTVEKLAFKDLKSLNSDLANVTSGDYPGYRVKKNGIADSLPVKLYLAFDPEKIPEGYTAKDVRTFYFDRDYRNWKMLSVDSLDLENNLIVSTIFNETDFINGVIKVPESPETGSFTPTMMTDMEYANPAAGIVSIQPPNINNTGNLVTGFPIKLPAGRNGMQPSLQVSYNSEGGNGWMGIGWDLSTPAITLNTKWGAPLFDNAKETEMYLLNGAELVMNVGDTIYTGTHRIEEVSRQSNREFYLRVEGGYSKVVRHGSSPVNYWWEVTDKLGNKSFYGGYNGSVVDNAVIKDSDNNIAHWALYRTEDPFGNYVQYEYDKSTATVGSSTVNAQGFYIKEIKYTLKSGVSNYYKVEFKRNAYTVSEPGGGTGFTPRKDITVNGRNGFLQITKDLLTEIHVSLVEGSAQRIRTYRFDYYAPEDVPFRKTLLKKIAEFDTEGVLFYSNTMEYFDEIEDNDIIDSNNADAWGGTNDNLSGIPGVLDGLLSEGSGSPIETSTTTGVSFGLRTGFGFDLNALSVAMSVGASFSHSQNNQNNRITFIDINGDGLPDKVIQNGGNVSYRPNTGSGFGSLLSITGINSFGNTKSKTNGFGVDASVSNAISIGTSRSTTRTETDNYFMDFNGDGLPDIAGGGKVLFNASGTTHNHREFTMLANQTENPIVGGSIDPSLLEFINVQHLDEVWEEHPQFDHIQVWEAPYTGTVNISSLATYKVKNANASDNHYRLTIEKKAYNQTSGNATVLESAQLDTLNQTANINKNALSITKGDVLFFRTHNLEYGSGGTVEWNPVITYTATSAGIHNGENEHNKSRGTFSIESDFMLNNGGGFDPGEEDSFTVHYNFGSELDDPYSYSDDIDFVIKRVEIDLESNEVTEQVVATRTYDHLDGDINNSPQVISFIPDPDKKILFYFEVRSTSNVAWDNIKWRPAVAIGGSTNYPPVNYVIYDENVNQSQYWIIEDDIQEPEIDEDGEADFMVLSHDLITGTHNSSVLDELEEEEFPIKINWVVKAEESGDVKVLYKRTFYLQRAWGGTYLYSQDPDVYTPTVTADSEFILSKDQVAAIDTLYTSFYIDHRYFAIGNTGVIKLDIVQAEQTNYPLWDPVILNSPFWSVSPKFYGLTYRNWGQFLYNGGITLDRDNEGEVVFDGNGDPVIIENFGDGPIDVDVFDFEAEADEMEEIDPEADPEEIEASSRASRFTLYAQDNENGKYINEALVDAIFGFDGNNDLLITTGRFAVGSLYDVYIDPESIIDNGNVFPAIKQRTISKGKAVTGSLITFSRTESEAKTDVLNQYIDLNGDRYPDIVTSGKIQYTNSLGGLSAKTAGNNFSAGSENEDVTDGVSIAAIKFNSTQRDNSKIFNMTTSNISGGLGDGKGTTGNARMFADMNGDGLPDKVVVTDDAIDVWLNTGYGFTSNKVVWGDTYSNFVSTRSNGSISVGGGWGGGDAKFNMSFAIGFGASFADADVVSTLLDVNGDGLPDLVTRLSGEYKYYLNTGTGFETSPKTFYEGSTADRDENIAGNIFGSITFGFTLPWFNIKIVFSPSGGVNAGFNEKVATIQDINGDGLPDVLLKDDDDNNSKISARLNQIGKTHLLKKVNNPLGGSWEVDYTRDGNTYDMPQSKWVITTIKTHDGFTGDSTIGLGPDETLTTVVYENPKYDRRERDFLGYEKVTVEQRHPENSGLFRYTLKEFHIDNIYLKGAEKAVSLYSNTNELLSRTETLYNLLDPDSPVVNMNAGENNHYLQSSLSAGLLDHSRLFVAVARTRNITFEDGMALVAVQEFTEYDEYGNLLKVISHGDTAADTFRSEITYHGVSDILSYGPGFPAAIEVYQHSTNTLMRKRTADYNNYGKLSEIVTKLNDTEDNTVELEYDSYGNLAEVHHIDSVNDQSDHYVQEISYDTTLHTYPVAFENSFGHTSSAEYNYLFGLPVFTTDMNGNSMRTRIDNRGRIIEVTGPNELVLEGEFGNTEPAWTIRMEYKGEDLVSEVVDSLDPDEYMTEAEGSFPAIDPGDPQPTTAQHYAVTRHFDAFYADLHSTETTNQLLTISIVDGFGQPVQLKKTHESDEVKWMVSGKEKKDPYGRVTEIYLPTTQEYPADYNDLDTDDLEYDTSISSNPLKYSYDIRDRQIKITQPGETLFTEIEYFIEDGMFGQFITNELGQTQKTYTDIRGRQRKTVQNDEITTQFKYNAVNDLIEVKNHQGYVTKSVYDMAGRRIRVEHPDQGVSNFTYDKAGNLTERITSNLILGNHDPILYHYTFNRLDSISYPVNPSNNVKYLYGNPGDPTVEANNAIGRLYMQEDASGVQAFGYDKMGNLTKNVRSVVVPGRQSYWFFTYWRYDSWNRVMEILYPDNDKVRYYYNKAGNVEKVTTSVTTFHDEANLVESITYTDYGEREKIVYGNGTETEYTYDTRRRMQTVAHQFTDVDLEREYGYDALSNITHISTEADYNIVNTMGQPGGSAEHTYTYDNYNRLITAIGSYTGFSDTAANYLKQEYELEMEYDLSHNIISKNQLHIQGELNGTGGMINPLAVFKTSYNLDYSNYATGTYVADGFGYVQPHAPRMIIETPTGQDGCCDEDDPRIKKKLVTFDPNGNQLEIKEVVGEDEIIVRKNLWDEENRLRAVDLNPDNEEHHNIAVYTYDASGQRILRHIPTRVDVYSNATLPAQKERDVTMIYPSGLITAKVINPDSWGTEPGPVTLPRLLRYTKHYYIGTERISSVTDTKSNLGHFIENLSYNDFFPVSTLRAMSNAQVEVAGEALEQTYDHFGLQYSVPTPVLEGSKPTPGYTDFNNASIGRYFFHPDHLGSSSYITDKAGVVSQHMEYLPFGELLVDEHLNSHNSPFKFNAKELDPETGNYYYGARYYNPKWSVWLSVDPMYELYPSFSPYPYTLQNPVRYTDPTGMVVESTDNDYRIDKKGNITLVKETVDDFDRILKTDSDGNTKIKGEGFLGFLVPKSERGKEKVAVDNISKGILKEGLNLNEMNNYFKVNGEGQPSLDEFNKFISDFSDFVGKEIAGVRLGKEESDKITGVLTYKYKGNSKTESKTAFDWLGEYNKKITDHAEGGYLKGHYHTQPYNDHKPSVTDLNIKYTYPTIPFFIISGGKEERF